MLKRNRYGHVAKTRISPQETGHAAGHKFHVTKSAFRKIHHEAAKKI